MEQRNGLNAMTKKSHCQPGSEHSFPANNHKIYVVQFPGKVKDFSIRRNVQPHVGARGSGVK